MTKVIAFLSGKKTYIIGACMVVLGLWQGDNKMVLDGIGFITMRAGIAKLQY